MSFKWTALVFFALLFTAFYAVAWSVLTKIRDDYRRYHPYAGGRRGVLPARRSARSSWRRWLLLLIAGLATAWVVVDRVLSRRPGP
jgi:H+/Cl- antiporter ClcA